jgi:environmental stress-induced protein Ves
MKLQPFSMAKLPVSLWKNGGGITREIVCQPPGTDAFNWRVSIAHISKDGPFSPFPGIDRIITLLEGGGVWLRTPDGSIDHRLEAPLQPFAFPGEAAIDGKLLLGACDDFNVMTNRATCRADVIVCRETQPLPASDAGVLLSLRGDWLVQGKDPLRARSGVWWHGAAPALKLDSKSPFGILLAVTIHQVAA